MEDVFAAIIRHLREDGFVPKERADTGSPERSLFSAVRRAHGMSPDEADVCFWNWRVLRPHLATVWAALDAEAGARRGATIQAHVWTFGAERTIDEVIDLVESAWHRYVGGPLVVGVRRPTSPGVQSADKLRGSLCNTLGAVRVARSMPMARLLIELVDRLPSQIDDEHLLAMLDDDVETTSMVVDAADQSELPKFMSRYYGSRSSLDTEQEIRWNFRAFLDHVGEALVKEPSDEVLLAWLKDRSPDPQARPARSAKA